jgi:hypothetical protein
MARKETSRFKMLFKTLREIPFKHYLLMGFILFMSPLTISYGDSQASLQVTNKTGYFLHVYINGEPHLYLAPKHSATGSATSTTLNVTVFYAPGQGVSGIIDRTFEAPYTPATTSSSGCSDSDNGTSCECSKSTTPAQYGKVMWTVTADTMLVNEKNPQEVE